MSENKPDRDQRAGSPETELKSRNKRNLAIALMLVGFVVLVYAVTILRIGSSVAERTF